MAKLSQGVSNLEAEYNKLDSGINNLNELNAGSKQLNAGAKTIQSKLKELEQSVSLLYEGSNELKTGSAKALEGIEKILKEMKEISLPDNTKKSKDIGKLIDSNKAQIENIKNSTDSTDQAIKVLLEKNNEVLKETKQGLDTDYSEKLKELSSLLGKLQEGIKKMNNGANKSNVVMSKLNSDSGVKLLAAKSDELVEATTKISAGMSKACEGEKSLISGSKKAKSGIVLLDENTQKLLYANNKLVDSAKEISKGANSLADGTDEFDNIINEKLGNLIERGKGIETLSNKYVKFNSDEKREHIDFILLIDSAKKSAQEMTNENIILNDDKKEKECE